jgi:acetyl-CoA carboxylase biotin carboxyl carrier protein
MPELDLETVRYALDVARKHGFAEVELNHGADAFSARLGAQAKSSSAGSAEASQREAPPAEPEAVPIRATLVGYYQEGPVPLRIGINVAKGDVVAVIAALGLANDVDSTVDGEVVEVLVEPDQPVEYGQALAMVRNK